MTYKTNRSNLAVIDDQWHEMSLYCNETNVTFDNTVMADNMTFDNTETTYYVDLWQYWSDMETSWWRRCCWRNPQYSQWPPDRESDAIPWRCWRSPSENRPLTPAVLCRCSLPPPSPPPSPSVSAPPPQVASLWRSVGWPSSSLLCHGRFKLIVVHC